MLWSSIDSIVTSVLLKQGRPRHDYVQYLAFACAGLQKLNTTTLRNVNSISLPVTSYKSLVIPVDYVDYVQVGYSVGERIKPMVYDSRLIRLNNFDSTGAKVIWPPQFPDGTSFFDYFSNAGWGVPFLPFYSNRNEAPFFNRPVDRDDYAFKVLPERNEIQLSANYPYSTAVLDYISDGQSSDAATKVDPLAKEAIEKFILWQSKVYSRTASEGEKQQAKMRFDDEHRLLRAAKNDLTKENIIHAIRSGYSGTYRN